MEVPFGWNWMGKEGYLEVGEGCRGAAAGCRAAAEDWPRGAEG